MYFRCICPVDLYMSMPNGACIKQNDQISDALCLSKRNMNAILDPNLHVLYLRNKEVIFVPGLQTKNFMILLVLELYYF